MEEKSIAMEMLQELKQTNKRNFVVILVLIVMLVATNIGWIIYESQYEYTDTSEVYTQETDYNDNSTITQDIN